MTTFRLAVDGSPGADEVADAIRGLAGSSELTDVIFLGDIAAYEPHTGEVAVDVRTLRPLDDREARAARPSARSVCSVDASWLAGLSQTAVARMRGGALAADDPSLLFGEPAPDAGVLVGGEREVQARPAHRCTGRIPAWRARPAPAPFRSCRPGRTDPGRCRGKGPGHATDRPQQPRRGWKQGSSRRSSSNCWLAAELEVLGVVVRQAMRRSGHSQEFQMKPRGPSEKVIDRAECCGVLTCADVEGRC